jgi:hypothetical protein
MSQVKNDEILESIEGRLDKNLIRLTMDLILKID